jgi:hypothetical protein
MFSPMKPLDPLIHNNMILVDENEIRQIIQNELDVYLESNNNKCGLPFNNSPYYLMHQNYLKENNKNVRFEIENNMGHRENQSEYYNIVNEFSNAREQFCSFKQLNKLFEFFDKSERKQSSNQEYETWMLSLENFIEKCTKNFNLFNDIINTPLAGFSLIGN